MALRSMTMAACLFVTSVALGAPVQGNPAPLPFERMETILGASGEMVNGVWHVDLDRDDLGEVKGPRGVTFTGSFELDGDLYFEPLGGGRAFLNADYPVKPEEANAFIAALLRHGLVYEAYHQHFPMEPQVFFVHFRGLGDPVALARAVRAALDATGVRLPKHEACPGETPLDVGRLATILHGRGSVGEDGVVTVTVRRKGPILLGGVRANPQLNLVTDVAFQPRGGAQAAVAADFGMTAKEIGPVVTRMLLANGWYQGCLYNQETDETPQLYFAHMLKTGDAYALAREIRSGLDRTASE